MPNPLVQSILIGLYVVILVGLIALGPRLIRKIALARQVPWFRPGPTWADANLADRVRVLEDRVARLEAAAAATVAAPPPAPAGVGVGPAQRADSGRPWPTGRRPSRREEGPILIAVPDLASAGVRNSAEAVAEFDRRFGAVWSLADEGLADDEIAARTGYPAGQVALILGLRRTPGGAASPLLPSPATPVAPFGSPADPPPRPSGGATDA